MPTLTLVTTQPAPVHDATVLTSSVIERLAALNAAARDLRAMGYRIVSESLRMDRKSPEIRIARDAQSIARLLNSGRDHQWKTVGDKRIGYTALKGVIVSWEESCNS
jgi:hypothetical protein